MSDTKLALNIGERIDVDGFPSITFKALTYDQQCQFAAWIERNAFEAIHRAKRFSSPDDDKASRSALFADIAAQMYEFDGPVPQKALLTPSGFCRAVFISASAIDPSVTEETIHAMFKKDGAAMVAATQRANGVDPSTGATATPDAPSGSDTSAPSSSTTPSG